VRIKVVKGAAVSTDEEEALAYHTSLSVMLDWFITEELVPRALKKGKYK